MNSIRIKPLNEPLQPVRFSGGSLVLLDQRKLPFKEVYIELGEERAVARAIKDMVVRGAPAIGVAAACGAALGARRIHARSISSFLEKFEKVCQRLSQTRPTAVNLFWALARMKRVAGENKNAGLEEIKARLVEEAEKILEEDIAANKRLGQWGQQLIAAKASVLTHCNAGALACAGYGTALGVVRAAREAGKEITLMATETRPRMQGARLTCWEMVAEGFPVTLICDTMVGFMMQRARVDVVLVGADRIAANGDVANKIGTYQLALLAATHRVPFYVAAPTSTIDLGLSNGKEIPIEYRQDEEVTRLAGREVAAPGVKVENPAFDVTPNNYVTAIITEMGIAQPPYQESLRQLMAGHGQ